MKENIFEDAKFGDKFVTKDGRVAVYLNEDNITIYNPIGKYHIERYNSNGLYLPISGLPNENNGFNIASRYQEPIDENKLVELAINASPELHMEECYSTWVKGFKTGYRKAKEE